MFGRISSLILVGLVIMMIFFGSFYMSCSSKAREFQRMIIELEERVKLVSMENIDNEREIEFINKNKRALEKEKLDIQSQVESKDTEINNINAKLQEKLDLIQILRSDKQHLEEQLKEFQNTNNVLNSKNLINEKLQQEYEQRQRSNDQELTDLKQQIGHYKNQLYDSQQSYTNPTQRYQPLILSNQIIQNSSLLSLSKFNQNIPNPNPSGNNSISNQIIRTNNIQQSNQNEPPRSAIDQQPNNLNISHQFQRSSDNNNNNQSQLLVNDQNNNRKPVEANIEQDDEDKLDDDKGSIKNLKQ